MFKETVRAPTSSLPQTRCIQQAFCNRYSADRIAASDILDHSDLSHPLFILFFLFLMRHSAGAESIATPDYLDHSDPSIVVGTLSFFLFLFIFSYPRLP